MLRQQCIVITEIEAFWIEIVREKDRLFSVDQVEFGCGDRTRDQQRFSAESEFFVFAEQRMQA